MKNRVINGTAMSFHAMGFWIAVAVILRMIIAVAKVFEIGNEVHYDDTFGDVYSLILLFLIGFLSYKKHRGLCASVNLSFVKTMLCLSFAAIIISLFFAVFDIGMVKGYFTEVDVDYYGDRFKYKEIYLEDFFLVTHLIPNATFIQECIDLFIEVPMIYFNIIIFGYLVRHMLSENILMLLSWVSATAIFIYIFENDDKIDELAIIITVFLLATFFVITISPVFSVLPITLVSGIEEIPFLILIMASVIGANAFFMFFHIWNNKYTIPKENRKDSIL